MIFIYTPCASRKEAETIAQVLLEQGLIACANLMPISSLFHWQDQIRSENEVVLLAKTRPPLKNKVVATIEEHHSYELPAIITIPAEANEAFEDWIMTETSD